MIWRPQRSKHCRYTDKCIPVYDHYSHWMGKAVGEGNRRIFVLALALVYSSLVLFLYLVWSMESARIGEAHFTTFTIKMLLNLTEENIFVVALTLITIPITIYLGWFLFLEVWCISDNITVNEAFRRFRYRYLYVSFQFPSGGLI